jgi:hypothetical protein
MLGLKLQKVGEQPCERPGRTPHVTAEHAEATPARASRVSSYLFPLPSLSCLPVPSLTLPTRPLLAGPGTVTGCMLGLKLQKVGEQPCAHVTARGGHLSSGEQGEFCHPLSSLPSLSWLPVPSRSLPLLTGPGTPSPLSKGAGNVPISPPLQLHNTKNRVSLLY